MKQHAILSVTILLLAAVLVLPASAVSNAGFSYTVDQSNPMTIHFTDTSSGSGNWFWTFNDNGATSSEKNPSHTFSAEGEYRVSLAVSDSNYENEETVMKWITITRSGIYEEGGGPSPGGAQPTKDGGSSLPSLSFGDISIPSPIDLISEYIKLIKTMLSPSSYQK